MSLSAHLALPRLVFPVIMSSVTRKNITLSLVRSAAPNSALAMWVDCYQRKTFPTLDGTAWLHVLYVCVLRSSDQPIRVC